MLTPNIMNPYLYKRYGELDLYRANSLSEEDMSTHLDTLF